MKWFLPICITANNKGLWPKLDEESEMQFYSMSLFLFWPSLIGWRSTVTRSGYFKIHCFIISSRMFYGKHLCLFTRHPLNPRHSACGFTCAFWGRHVLFRNYNYRLCSSLHNTRWPSFWNFLALKWSNLDVKPRSFPKRPYSRVRDLLAIFTLNFFSK